MSVLLEVIIFLGAAVLAVPLAKKTGLGAIIGYLIAGILIGPYVLGLVDDVEEILDVAEIGVVLLLFIIGLELQPSRLWTMRKMVFGVGSAQVLITGALLTLAAISFGLQIRVAILAGLTLALSSTAFALQTLAEKKQLTTRHGRAAFSILLFQDLAVVPLLALVPIIGATQLSMDAGSVWLQALKALAALAVIVIGGRYVLRYAMRIVAATGIQEVFTALALLTVFGTALIAEMAGLSMALGAFLGGVLLADSEYRHALEADIQPFKGLLLGLFFISVGMSVDVVLIFDRAGVVIGLVALLIILKGSILYFLGRSVRLSHSSARSLAVAISQGGEFAFVIFGVAVTGGIIERSLAALLIIVVTLSMAVTPLLFVFDELLRRRQARKEPPEYDTPMGEEHQVIIAGFGRFGQIIARILRARKISFTALDNSAEQVDFVKKYGSKIYYGDASRLDLLRAAKADQAAAFVLAIDDVEASLRTAETVIRNFPDLKIYARARNRKHVYQLMDLGVTIIERDTFLSSLDMAREVLRGLGLSKVESERAVETFKRHDVKRLCAHQHLHHDEEKMAQLAQKAAQELEVLFEQDAKADLSS